MAFEPDATDKVRNIGGREKIPAYMFVDPDDPSVVYIKPYIEDIKDNSEYQVVIPELNFSDGDTVNRYKVDYYTAVSPCYVDVDEVMTLCSGLKINKKDLIRHIRNASNIADYWAYYRQECDDEIDENIKVFDKSNIKSDYYPFYMYIKYKAASESVRQYYINIVCGPEKFKDKVSDLERTEEMNFEAIHKLLDDLNTEAEDWLGLIISITADPAWAVRGKYSYAITMENYRPYHNTMMTTGRNDGWNRGY